MTEVQILATGPELVREGARAIEPVIEELMLHAKTEIHMVAYVFTPQASRFLTLLKETAERGIRLTIVVNHMEGQDRTVRDRLMSLAGTFAHAKVTSFSKNGVQLHAKAVVADRKRAVVGSANFSWGGMATNYELGVLLEGDAAWHMARLIDLLASRSTS
jgi:cardiolipin synthase